MAKRKTYPKITVGDRFGMWTVQSAGEPYINPRGASFARWVVRCDCGTEGLRNQPQLRSGQSTDCGCQRAHKQPEPGTRFGKLVVQGAAQKVDRHHRTLCRCDCGAEKEVLTFSLTSGHSRACGACRGPLSEEGRCAVGNANRTHGQSGTPEYRSWRAMRDRCLNKQNKAYSRYGGRGITICPQWIDSFEAFFSHMGCRPSSRHTLERVNNELGYSPENCEWREWEDQNRNRRNTVFVEFEGETVPLAALAAESPIPYGEVHRRVVQMGWDVSRAISTPLRVVNRRRT